ncbi:MAG: hypothetical protein WBB98_13300 [Xanthobacteraceae bacterium]
MTGPHVHHVEARAKRQPARQFISDTHEHRPDDGRQIYASIVTILGSVAAKDEALLGAIEEDIRRNGLRWAAKRIKGLREDLARCRRELRAANARVGGDV